MEVVKVIENLNRRGYIASYAETSEQATVAIMRLIPEGACVGFGGSRTVQELKIPSKIKAGNYKILHRGSTEGMTDEQIMKLGISASEWFLAGANAITEAGEIVNVDGTGNRVAGMIYGAQNIVCVAGINKIVKDIPAAFERVKTTAARLNMLRLGRTAPCVEGGSCDDCAAGQTICKVTAIHHHPTTGKNFYVILVGEDIGF